MMACNRLSDLVQLEVDLFDPPTPKYHTLETNMKRIVYDPLRRYRRFLLARAHCCHISTSGGSSGDRFRIAHPHFLFIFNSDYGSIWLIRIIR